MMYHPIVGQIVKECWDGSYDISNGVLYYKFTTADGLQEQIDTMKGKYGRMFVFARTEDSVRIWDYRISRNEILHRL